MEGGERICVIHESVFDMVFFFLSFFLMGSLGLEIGGGSVLLDISLLYLVLGFSFDIDF